jgi:YjbE family integral membrane protein
MWRELKDTSHKEEDIAIEAVYEEDINSDGVIAKSPDGKTFAQAAWQIIIADVSMSLDNVLAVAGAADGHLEILAIGLILSIALMGLAASFIARLLNKHRWIAFVGLAIILYVAIKMIYDGILEILPHIF